MLKEKNIKYPNKRVFGIWLIWIGLIVIIGTIFGGKFMINPIIFALGFIVGKIVIFRMTFIKKHLSYGPNSKFQSNINTISILMMFVLIFLFSGKYIMMDDLRMTWFGALLATAIHFITSAFVYGKQLIILSILLILNVFIGIFNSNISFDYFGYIDGLIKIIFGIFLLVPAKANDR
ncbi:DUF6609 family protein [Peribacillus frigoritolerans]|uniref:DUF6609 family protein n=1 Tax=Peribacillus frigoritolerans TaxID=450367 RepID=UPI0032E397A7